MSAIEYTITPEATTAEAPAPATDRPENVPEEFWDAEKKAVNTEALLAAYAETKKAPQDAAAKTPEEDGEGVEKKAGDAAAQIAEEAGVSVPDIEAHFAEHGEIPADAYEKLSKVGIDKTTVDEFIELRKAQAEQVRNEMLGTVGGEEAVNKMLGWAAENWSEAQANAFNTAAASKDRAQIELALAGLKTSYEKANPPVAPRPSLVKPGASSPAGGDTYSTTAEMVRDVSDPRYHKDPVFRRGVEEKVRRSPHMK